jgi:hypothetical protein
VPRFVAHVQLYFNAGSIRDGGQRLRELSELARSSGFDLRAGRIEPAPPDSESESGWTRYGPEGS